MAWGGSSQAFRAVGDKWADRAGSALPADGDRTRSETLRQRSGARRASYVRDGALRLCDSESMARLCVRERSLRCEAEKAYPVGGKLFRVVGKAYFAGGKLFRVEGKAYFLRGKLFGVEGKAYFVRGKLFGVPGKAYSDREKLFGVEGKAMHAALNDTAGRWRLGKIA